MNYTTSNNDLKQVKDNELQAVYEYLQTNIATATQVAVALNIYRPNLCRRKRKLETVGKLAVIKKGICPITKHTAALLTTNPALFPNPSQLNLF
jgi:aminopeptidase-like protein